MQPLFWMKSPLTATLVIVSGLRVVLVSVPCSGALAESSGCLANLNALIVGGLLCTFALVQVKPSGAAAAGGQTIAIGVGVGPPTGVGVEAEAGVGVGADPPDVGAGLGAVPTDDKADWSGVTTGSARPRISLTLLPNSLATKTLPDPSNAIEPGKLRAAPAATKLKPVR